MMQRCGPGEQIVRNDRAGCIIIQNNLLALIERQRDGQVYYVVPGGTVETGESLQTAARREAKKELGVDVAVGRLVARIRHNKRMQHYFLCHTTGGVLGTGTGPEMRGEYPPEQGTYRAIRLPLSALGAVDLRPAQLKPYLIADEDWPNDVLEFQDDGLHPLPISDPSPRRTS